jgi:TonB family protein
MRSAVAPGAVVLDRMAPGEGLASPRDSGGGGAVGAAPGGAKGDPRRGPQLQLDYQDYDRIYGQQADRERRLGTDALGDGGGGGREQSSWRKGRWAARQAAMRSALENFIPEVRPGNQTALNTRAYPFARYLTEMHRSIHKLWGFGFLQDLDNKSPANPMNDRKLVTKVEVVLLADGRVDSVSIARSSGNLTFDIAASDVVIAAGPFPAPPEAIRSKNGKVYLHWSFHRDDRQCATSGVEPFILDNPPREKPGALGRSLVPGTFRAQGPVPTPSWPLTWPGKPAPRTLTPFGAGAKEEVAHP